VSKRTAKDLVGPLAGLQEKWAGLFRESFNTFKTWVEKAAGKMQALQPAEQVENFAKLLAGMKTMVGFAGYGMPVLGLMSAVMLQLKLGKIATTS
jgi:hypothetical protein